jgi:hypothetical protein
MMPGNWSPPAYPAWPPPPPPGYPVPVPYPTRLRPRASGSVALPLVGFGLLVLCLLLLPFADTGEKWLWLPQISSKVSGSGLGFGAGYVAGWCYVLAFFGTLYAFAANLDSTAFRWLHFGFFLPAALFAMVGVLVAASDGARHGSVHWDRVVIAGGAALLAIAVFVALALVKGVACRTLGALMLFGYAIVHTAALIDLIDKHAKLLPFAFLGTVGYLLYGIGAVVGPRYVPSLR